jgi:hypothetical protein
LKARKPTPVHTNHFVPFIIHRVECSNQKDHTDHPTRADYFDVPRVFFGDSRASNLRGEEPIDDIDEYLENHEEISLIWVKVYSCDAYLESIRDQFEVLRAPLHPMHPMHPMLMRHFSFLPADGDEATPEREEITIVDDMIKNAVEEAIDIPCERISTAARTQETSAAVSQLYIHLRQPDKLADGSATDLEDLLRYMDMAFVKEYQAADDLFAQGCVTRKHLAKLFWKDGLIVASRGGHPRAYLLEGWPRWEDDKFVLPCVTWSLMDNFSRRKRSRSNTPLRRRKRCL